MLDKDIVYADTVTDKTTGVKFRKVLVDETIKSFKDKHPRDAADFKKWITTYSAFNWFKNGMYNATERNEGPWVSGWRHTVVESIWEDTERRLKV